MKKDINEISLACELMTKQMSKELKDDTKTIDERDMWYDEGFIAGIEWVMSIGKHK